MSDGHDEAARPPRAAVTTYVYDESGHLNRVEHLTEEEWRQYEARLAARAVRPRYQFEHDAAARVYRLTAPDGSVEVFRDNPTRYLCVEPADESGRMRPVLKHGWPVYQYLCREEREVR